MIARDSFPDSLLLDRPSVGKKLHVGNLTYVVTNGDLEKMFKPWGTVQSADAIMTATPAAPRASALSRWAATRRPRRPSRARVANEVDGRRLTVNEGHGLAAIGKWIQSILG
jgi:cold-inducible RNA-binding protein